MRTQCAQFVCWIEQGYDAGNLINDAKALTWEHEAEHTLLQLATGQLALVRGGRDGIVFSVHDEGSLRTLHMEIDGRDARVVKILWHTHPRVTGPSDGDREALAILGQIDSVIYEIGGDRMGLASHPHQIPQRVNVPGGVGIIDTIEMTETLRIAHAPGVVVVLDAFPSNDPQFFVGREIQILYPDGRVRTVTVDAVRDHGVTISFFFRGWTRTDVPAGSRIEFG